MNILRWIRSHPWKTGIVVLVLLVIGEFLTIPWLDVPRLTRANPEETALMRQREEEATRSGKKLRIVHQWTPLSRLPKSVCDAVIVAEDGMFYAHSGFDWYEVQQSVHRNLHDMRFARGGSTITQQLAKNLYLSTSKDPIRKVKEAIITILLEHYLTKDRILELYLNDIEWGNGIFGIEAAARTFFHKSASDLTAEEANRLAAVIPSPLVHRPDFDSRYVLRRSAIVERRLEARKLGIPIVIEEDDSTTGPFEMTPESTQVTDSGKTKGGTAIPLEKSPDSTQVKDSSETEGH